MLCDYRDAIKLEGGRRVVPQIEAVVDAGINVMGHIGLTPQTAAALGGYRVQGKSAAAAEELLADAKALEAAVSTQPTCYFLAMHGPILTRLLAITGLHGDCARVRPGSHRRLRHHPPLRPDNRHRRRNYTSNLTVACESTQASCRCL